MVSHQIKYTLKTDKGGYLVEATEIDDIQCRYIAFKLAENSVKRVVRIKQIDKLKYTLKTQKKIEFYFCSCKFNWG